LQSISSYLTANKFYAPDGTSQPITRFSEVALNLYGEFGVTDRLTTGVLLPGRHLTWDAEPVVSQPRRSYTGIGDMLLTNRYQLLRSAVLVSAGLDLGLPTGNSTEPNLLLTGDGEFNGIMRLVAASGFQAGLPIFYQLGTGYNKRTRGFSDEIHYSVLGGVRLWSLSIFATLEGVESLKNASIDKLNFSALLQNNSSYLAWSSGFYWHITETVNVSFAYKSAFFGENILAAPSFLIGVGILIR